jgi:O-acetylhomoserine (thiol)-lyase
MRHIHSQLIHGNPDECFHDPYGSLKIPIYETASFDFRNSEDVEKAFRGENDAYTYSRISNPTVSELQNRLKLFSGADHCLCVSSGMAAISNVFITLCSAGDNIITSSYLFGNTWSLFAKTLCSFGVEVRFTDMENHEEIFQNIDKNTRAIFLELPTNPQLIIFDVDAIAEIASSKNIPLIADNTVLTPYLFSCKAHNIDIEIFSNTKFVSGGATSIGGTILIHASEKWQHVPKLADNWAAFGKDAFYKRLYKEVYRNLGSCLSPHSAYLQLLGLETIALRIDRIIDNTFQTAVFLQTEKHVKQISQPGLPGDKYYNAAQKYMKGKSGCLINFELKDKDTCFAFMDALKMVRRGTNFCDNKSMIIHPASTIYWDFSDAEKERMRITNGSLRLSVGLENIEDITDDLKQAFERL